MKQLALTVIGPDRPGLVDDIAKAVLNHQGHWLASNLSHLAGHFAGIVQIEVPESELSAVRASLDALSDLEIQMAPCLDKPSAETSDDDTPSLLNFVITGNDRPGIVQELSSVISHKGGNIVHFTSKRQSAPNWGVPLFNAVATVQLAKGMNKDEVIRALESITADLTVDVEDE